MTYYEFWVEYAVKLGKSFKMDKNQLLSDLKYDSIRESLNTSYGELLKKGVIEPIENLEKKEKQRIWDITASYSSDQKIRIGVSKAIYLLETITAEN